MAKLRPSYSHPPIQGKFGDKIYKWYGKTCVVQKLPVRRKRRRVTAKLKAAYDNMRQAVGYAQRVIADPAARAYYAEAARRLRRSVYLVAKADAMKAPTLALSEFARFYKCSAGELCMIGTGDLFRVQTLHLTVRDPNGDIVETGDAVRKKKDFLYYWKRDHPHGPLLTIEVVAESRAGHRVSLVERVSRRA